MCQQTLADDVFAEAHAPHRADLICRLVAFDLVVLSTPAQA